MKNTNLKSHNHLVLHSAVRWSETKKTKRVYYCDDSFEGSISEITAFTKVTLNDVFALMADVGLARTDTRTRRRI